MKCSPVNQLTFLSAGTIIEAGSDTTRNQINLMLAAAAKYPEWVKKSREELDSVLGDAKRLPDFDVSASKSVLAVIS
jgi:cytochrome P450